MPAVPCGTSAEGDGQVGPQAARQRALMPSSCSFPKNMMRMNYKEVQLVKNSKNIGTQRERLGWLEKNFPWWMRQDQFHKKGRESTKKGVRGGRKQPGAQCFGFRNVLGWEAIRIEAHVCRVGHKERAFLNVEKGL